MASHGRVTVPHTPRQNSPRCSWIRSPISPPPGRRLRVLIYARYSTDEQNPRSIDDQVAYCRRFLTDLGHTDVDCTVHQDRGISGEQLFRPGIDRVRGGIASQLWDVILVEDSSRLFRNQVACAELAGSAVDQGVRLICINDEVDTADEETWEDRLHESARHHARSNRYTSRRIKRALEALWDSGAAIGQLKPGYRRVASQPATEREPARGPYYDEIDPAQADIVRKAYERMAAGELPGVVGRWLTQQGLPKTANAKSSEWSDVNVIRLIRRPDYRGVQVYRATVSKKQYRTGLRKPARNEQDQVLSRTREHLRIVPDWLWFAANKAIDDRNLCRERPSEGRTATENGLPGPRSPVLQTMTCHCCGSRIYGSGRRQGGYRCSRARNGGCWNKATAIRQLAHQAIANAIADQLRQLGGTVDVLLGRVQELLGNARNGEARRRELEEERSQLETMVQRLTTAIETSDSPPASLTQQLAKRERELLHMRSCLEELVTREEHLLPPSPEEVQRQINMLLSQLEAPDLADWTELESLIGPIEVIPCQQVGSPKVVLRAKFALRLSYLLPIRVRAALAELYDTPIEQQFEQVPMSVDLFEPALHVQHARACAALKQAEPRLSLKRIGAQLGLGHMTVKRCLAYARRLDAAGLIDPYLVLGEQPELASRWKPRQPR